MLLIHCIGSAQSLTEIANKYLGQPIESKEKLRIKTNYGTLTFKVKTSKTIAGKKKLIRLVVTITNDSRFYDSIINNADYGTFRVGTIWTDLIFNYQNVYTEEFTDYNNAKDYFDSFMYSECKAHEEVKLYQHRKRKSYKVARVIYSENGKRVICDDDEPFFDIKKWEIINFEK